MRRFVLLDRDGTLISDRHYLADPAGVELLPGVGPGLRQLQQLDLGLVVITNQSGVGRGYFGQEQVAQVHRRMEELLDAEQVKLDGIYYCPHTPEEHCPCRKPAAGLVQQAASDLGFEPQQCFVIGDRACDIELGRRIGALTFLVGAHNRSPDEEEARPDFVVASLANAAAIVIGSLSTMPVSP